MTDRRHGIAMVIDALDRGGAERVLISLANGLDPERYRVLVVTTRRPGVLAHDLAPHVEQVSLDRRSRWDLRAIRRFGEIIDRAGVGLVHTHSHFAAYFVRLAARGSPGWLHVMHDHCAFTSRSRSMRVLDRIFLPEVDFYVAVSEPLTRYARDTIGIDEDRVLHLHNGVAVPPANGSPPAGPFTIIQVANLGEHKNQLAAIATAARLKAAGLEFSWLLAGRTNSAYGRRCRMVVERAGLSEQVRFLGERNDVEALLTTAHVGVLTSHMEGLPVAMLEYMAAGLPVVVTDAGDCGRVVRAARCGSVVADGSPAALADVLLALAADPDRRAQLGDAGRRHVEEHHGVNAMVRRIQALYASLLEAPLVASAGQRRPA